MKEVTFLEIKDTIIKGTGNSRSLASVPNFLTMYPTYEAFAQALINRELPIDIGPLNPTGCDVIGTSLNAALIGQFSKIETGSYVGTGKIATRQAPCKITLRFAPKQFYIYNFGTKPDGGERFGGRNSPMYSVFCYNDHQNPSQIFLYPDGSSNSTLVNIYITFLNDGIEWYQDLTGIDGIQTSFQLNGWYYRYLAFG